MKGEVGSPSRVPDGRVPRRRCRPACWRRTTAVCGVAAFLLVARAPAASSQDVRTGEAERLTISGLVGATLFTQDELFGPGNGQNAQWVDLDDIGRWWLGGDVRNTRLLLEIAGPRIGRRWRTGGTVEADFFGGHPGTGAYVAEQPQPRLRLAFGQLSRGGTTLRLGQDWAPLAGYVPESVTHIAFPLGYGSAGQIGWRFPGLFVFQDLARGRWGRVGLHAAIMRGGWNDAADPELPTAGQQAGVPQVQARVDVESEERRGTSWGVHLTGHVDRKDIERDMVLTDRVTGHALQLGARIRSGVLTIHGNVYTGRAMGHHAAHISQFGDIRGRGAWAQLGISPGRRWSTWSFFGTDDPRDEDLDPDSRLRNRVFAQMVRFEDGPFAAGLEWLHARTLWWPSDLPAGTGGDLRVGNQIALSVLLAF